MYARKAASHSGFDAAEPNPPPSLDKKSISFHTLRTWCNSVRFSWRMVADTDDGVSTLRQTKAESKFAFRMSVAFALFR